MPHQGNSPQNTIPKQPANNHPPTVTAPQSSNNIPYNTTPQQPVINTPKPPIILQNPPSLMPKLGTKDYEDLLKETGGASANPGFNYSAHITATRNNNTQNTIPQQSINNHPPTTTTPQQPVINTPKPSIILQNPPAFMPKPGTRDYEDLLKETGGASANPGFNYSAHIAVTRSDAIPYTNKGTTPVILGIPTAIMPPKGSFEYDKLLAETGGASANSAFNYRAHIIATRGAAAAAILSPENTVKPTLKGNTQGTNLSDVLKTPPRSMPSKGTAEYDQLLVETGGASANSDFSYEGHIFATRGSQAKEILGVITRIVEPAKSFALENSFTKDKVTGALLDGSKLNKSTQDFKFYNLGQGRLGISEKGSQAISEITDANTLNFSDKSINVISDVATTFSKVSSHDGPDAKMFRLYNAAFNRLPDPSGLDYWISEHAEKKMDIKKVAENFIISNEFADKYGKNIDNQTFARNLYSNILGRTPDAEGLNYWIRELDSGKSSRIDVLASFSESAENKLLYSQITGLV